MRLEHASDKKGRQRKLRALAAQPKYSKIPPQNVERCKPRTITIYPVRLRYSLYVHSGPSTPNLKRSSLENITRDIYLLPQENNTEFPGIHILKIILPSFFLRYITFKLAREAGYETSA